VFIEFPHTSGLTLLPTIQRCGLRARLRCSKNPPLDTSFTKKLTSKQKKFDCKLQDLPRLLRLWLGRSKSCNNLTHKRKGYTRIKS